MISINKRKQAQFGQSMTEFLICASFALVPLFLGISLLAKYIDIKQTAIQAARYEVWEYTVWYANNSERSAFNPDGELSSGFNAVDQPIKSTALTQSETQQRFFNGPGNGLAPSPITATDSTTGWTPATANPFWVDHTGQPLYAGVNGAGESINSSADTPTIPVIGDVMDTLLFVIDAGFSAVRSLMKLANSDVGFTAINTNGNAEATVSMQVAVNPTFVANYNQIDATTGTTDEFTGTTLDFSTSASVLSDAWNAGGVEHVYNQAGGAVPTTLLNQLITAIPGLETAINAASLLAPEMRLCNPGGLWGPNDKGSFWLGYVDVDAVHPDRLAADPTDPDTRNGVHVCDEAGICTFEPVIPRTEDSRECDPTY
jgi:hypothetical protein